MNRKNIVCMGGVTVNIVLAVILGYYLTHTNQQKVLSADQGVHLSHEIALFLPASHPALDEISEGFTRMLKSEISDAFNFTLYNANGNKTLLRAQSEEIVNGNYDLVFTVGTACTQTMKELTTKKQIALPIVFGAVGDPVGMQIVASLQASGNHITGVCEGENYKQQLTFLKALKPSCKSVLLVFDPSSMPQFEYDKIEIARECNALGIQFRALEVYNPNEISQKVPALLGGVDTLLILKDHTTVGALDNLIKLCNQAGVTLYASDLNSGDKGAALSYGIREADTGIAAAHAAKLVLQGHAPSDIPILSVKPLRIKLNTHVMHRQGLDVLPFYIDLMALGEVI